MALIDSLKRLNENREIKRQARAQAQLEAEDIRRQQEIQRQQDLYTQAKDMELERQTTSAPRRFTKQVGGSIKEFGMQGGQIVKDLGRTITGMPMKGVRRPGVTSKRVMRKTSYQAFTLSPKPKDMRGIVDLDNTQTDIGNKIFGNTFKTRNKVYR